MANTEGMPDEFIDSIATVSARAALPGGGRGGGPSTTTTVTTSTTAEERRRLRLQQRMHMPLGETPAAKVVRLGKNTNVDNRVHPSRVRFDENSTGVSSSLPSRQPSAASPPPSSSARSTNSSQSMSLLSPIVGNVVERDNRPLSKTNKVSLDQSTTKSKQQSSRFAQRQQNKTGSGGATATGFPSVHVPFGTFVKPPKKKKINNNSNRKKNGIETIQQEHGVTPATPIAYAPPPPPSGSKNVSNNQESIINEDSMEAASRKDADAMLSNMSVDEIRQFQQEVQSSLSPAMVDFLKRRGAAAGGGGAGTSASRRKRSSETTSDEPIEDKMGVSSSSSKSPQDQFSEETVNSEVEHMQERKEKERIANLISSVETHEDLDSVYQKELQQTHPLDQDGDEQRLAGGNFEMACDLLRSTSSRQTLWAARTVSLALAEMAAAQSTVPSDNEGVLDVRAQSSLPTILPVSLRCLLDKPMSTTYLLHTYALQALYSLTMICSSQRDGSQSIDIMDEEIYQINFLDDAVPTPSMDELYAPVSVQPLAVGGENDMPSSAPAAAYSTSSSTTSAMADAQAFERDPMWTLLSKMRILPRLAFLAEKFDIPAEAWVAICGLLSMLGRRSPGAASAIVQHDSLVSNIQKRMLQELQGTREQNHCEISLAALRLFCVLARQSRVAAEGLPLEDILPPVVASTASSNAEFQSQQLALVLWRTVLRYGLGLPALASMLTLASRHLALPYSNQYSLSTEYVSAFAQILECTRVIATKSPDTVAGALERGQISGSALAVLGTAAKYLSSTMLQLLPATTTPTSRHAGGGTLHSDWILRYRWNSARLSFLSTWIGLPSAVRSGDNDAIASVDELALDNQMILLEALHAWADAGGDVEIAWSTVVEGMWGRPTSLDEAGQTTTADLEAAMSAFLTGFFSVVSALSHLIPTSDDIRVLKISLDRKISERVIVVTTSILKKTSRDNVKDSRRSLARKGWVTQCRFAVAKFLLHALKLNVISSSSNLTLARSLVFSLLSHLRRGNEAMAAILFSSDDLFQVYGNPLPDETIEATNHASSPISSLFLGELCASDHHRKQLDHSFKLLHGFGITLDGLGPFGLHSLLSAADRGIVVPSSNETNGRSVQQDSVLPLNYLWLWQTLSGPIRVRMESVVRGTSEAIEVVGAVLSLLLELDEAEEMMELAGYASRLPLGSKLYYLMNMCLQPEAVIRDERVLAAADAVLDRYLDQFGDLKRDILSFCQECFRHSDAAKLENAQGDDVVENGKHRDDLEDDMEEKNRKIFEDFLNQGPDPILDKTAVALSPSELRSLGAFVEDMGTAYRDYGAQYGFFTRCVRVFLLPPFPPSIRCRLLEELEGMLHLLTLPKEASGKGGLINDEMKALLLKSVSGGLPDVDLSHQDNPMFLDALTSSLVGGDSRSRPLQGFILHYTTALLARGLAISIHSNDQAGMATLKRRLESLAARTVDTICNATAEFLQQGGTKDALVDAVLFHNAKNDDLEVPRDEGEKVDARFVDDCIARVVNRII